MTIQWHRELVPAECTVVVLSGLADYQKAERFVSNRQSGGAATAL